VTTQGRPRGPEGGPTRNGSTRASDPDWFRQVLGQYPTGVSVVTGIAADGKPAGLAVGSFTSVSLDPPLVAFLPDKRSSSWPRIEPAGRFCVNILAADQEDVCRVFASKARDKFADLAWRPAASGAPILDDAVAWVDCELEAVHDAGDHYIVVGRVTDLDIERPTLPLLFFQGGYGRFSPQSLVVRDARFRVQLQLVDRARPLMEQVARRTGEQVVAAYCDGHELTLLASAGSPSNPDAPSAAIGQHLPVTAPIGIWWMAFADPGHVDGWLVAVQSQQLQVRYREALVRIREHRYSFGLGAVHAATEVMINKRPGPGSEPTLEERVLIAGLTLDPLDYVPVEPGAAARERGDVVSLWAPTFTSQGEVGLGLMLTRPSGGDEAPSVHAEDLLDLAAAVTALAAS